MKESTKQQLKTLCEEPTELKTEYKTLSDIKVALIDYTQNPYKMMFEMALMTWNGLPKWNRANPETRFEVIKKILERKALPLALEAPFFSFQIEDVSRAAFDQIARTRYGVVFSSKGFKDDNLHQTGFMIPSHFTNDEVSTEDIKKLVDEAKSIYARLIERGHPNWAARCVIPMYSLHSFCMGINYFSLQSFCGNRMQTTEMEDTVTVAWLLRERVKDVFPLLAEYLRPSCDWSRRDMTGDVNGFSDSLGIPHASDNRQPGYDETKYPEVRWNEPCTDIEIIEKSLNISLPRSTDWKDYTFETLDIKDILLFSQL